MCSVQNKRGLTSYSVDTYMHVCLCVLCVYVCVCVCDAALQEAEEEALQVALVDLVEVDSGQDVLMAMRQYVPPQNPIATLLS